MKAKRIYSLYEVESKALDFLKEKHFGGLSPSDHDSGWTWGECYDRMEDGTVYGIWLRFGLQIFVCSFADDLGLYPMFSKGSDRTENFCRKSCLSDEQMHELKVCGLLKRV